MSTLSPPPMALDDVELSVIPTDPAVLDLGFYEPFLWAELVEMASALQEPSWPSRDKPDRLFARAPDGSGTQVILLEFGSCADITVADFQARLQDHAWLAYTGPETAGRRPWVLVVPLLVAISDETVPALLCHLNAALGDLASCYEVLSEVSLPNGGTGFLSAESEYGTALDAQQVLREVRAVALVADTAATPPPVRFPDRAYRGVFGDYRQLLAGTTEAADEFHFAALLAVMSFLVGRRTSIRWGPGRLFPILHVAIIGETGKARKSTAIDEAIDLIGRPLMTPRRSGVEPVDQILMGLGSGEGFADAMADDPSGVIGRKVLFVIHELAALIEKANTGKGGALIDFIIAAYDARHVITQRTRGRGEVCITDGVGVFLGASTFEWLRRNVKATHISNGAMNRFLWFDGGSGKPIAVRPPIDRGEIETLTRKCRQVLHQIDGVTMALTDKARTEHTERYLQERKRPSQGALVDAMAARADSHALKVAMLLAVAEGQSRVTADHIATAWAVVAYSSDTAGRIARAVEGSVVVHGEDRVVSAARRVATVAPHGRFTRRDVFQRLKGARGMRAAEFNSAFSALERSGVIVAVGRRGRTTTYRWVGA